MYHKLYLGNNQLSGTVPHSIFNLSSVTQLYQGFLPFDMLINLPNIKYLTIGQNQFTGSIPTLLSNASNLGSLELEGKFFTGKVPSIHKLSMLNYLFQNNNSLGTRGPDALNFLCSLTNATDLQSLRIGSNDMGGSLPECIGTLSAKLLEFKLDHNHISSDIPAGISMQTTITSPEQFQNHISSFWTFQ